MGNGEIANGDQMSSFRAMFSTLFPKNNLTFFNNTVCFLQEYGECGSKEVAICSTEVTF